MRHSLSQSTMFPCAYSSSTRWCSVSPAPKVNATARSAPIWLTPLSRLPLRCIRSLALNLDGWSALRSRAYDVV